MSAKEKRNKKYEFVAPDGGWGYMICFGVTVNLMFTSGFATCFGMIFKDLFIELKMDSTTVTFFNGFSIAWLALASFMTNPLLKYMSIRKLGVAAALIFNVGMFGTVFTNSTPYFFVFQGFLQGIGHGIIYNVSSTSLNNYYVKRRLLAVSCSQTFVAAFAFVMPQLVKWCLETYGSRGTLLMISALSMHSILGMTLMQPVSWHMKRVEVPADKDNETMSLLVEDKTIITNKEDLTVSIKLHKLENATEGIDINNMIVEEKIKDHSSRQKKLFTKFIDISELKSFMLSNASIGNSLCFFSEWIFTLMLPQALYFMGWNESEVAWALSLNALGDLVTRTLFIFLSGLLSKVGSHDLYVVGLVIATASRLGMLWSDNRKIMLTFLTIMGVSRCTIMLLVPIVVADAVDPKNFTSALGFFFLLNGFFQLAVGPVIGTVRDMTDSYTTAFYVLTSFFAIVAIFWSIELYYKRSKNKRQPKMDMESKP